MSTSTTEDPTAARRRRCSPASSSSVGSRSSSSRIASRRPRTSPPPHASPTPRCYEQAALDPDAFWAEQARTLHWDEPFTTVLDDSNPPFYKWFTDGKLNVSYNCLDRHVEAGHGDRVAFHWAGEEGEQRAITYAELHARRAAARERAQGRWAWARATSSGSTCR